MDASEVAKLTVALPRRYADRLPEPTINNLEIIASGGETPELLDVLVAALAKYDVPISAAERDELASLLAACHMPTADLQQLSVTG